MPKGATIGAIVRGLSVSKNTPSGTAVQEHEDHGTSAQDLQVIIAHHDTVIESEDHVILFVINRKMIRQVEQLFQVNVGFL